MKKIPVTFLSMLFCGTLFAQDAHFSQYNSSRMWTNPAFAGCDSTLNLSFSYRNQWPKVDAYQSYFFSADKYFKCLRGGLGISLLHDDQSGGVLTTSRIDLNYAAHIELAKHRLVIQPGVQVAYAQRHIDLGMLTFGDMIDERRGFVYNTNEVTGQTTRSFVDLSAGVLVYTSHVYGGFSAHHLTEPDEGFFGPDRLPLKLTAHVGANIPCGNKNTEGLISPNVLYMQQRDAFMLMPGVALKIKWFSISVNYRSQDALIGTLAFQNRFLRAGYSYDYTTSALTNDATGGAHEIALTWFMNFKKSVCTRNTLRLI